MKSGDIVKIQVLEVNGDGSFSALILNSGVKNPVVIVKAAQQGVKPTGLRAWSKEELAKALSIGQEESGENASG